MGRSCWGLALALALPLALSACFDKRPSEAEVARLMAKANDNALMHVENVAVVNGFEESDKVFVADLAYDVVFDRGAREVTSICKANSLGDSIMCGATIFALTMKFGDFKAGERFHLTDSVTFIRKDKGWEIRPAS